MRVLLTNNTLDIRAGSELYIRDIAIELMRRGQQPVAYSTKLGAVADELRSATVPVIDRLSALAEPPDIIHGQHHYETFSALLRFPNTPAIYFCHGWLPWEEATLRHPNIVRYVAVDQLCRERLVTEGAVAPDKVDVVLNFFDQRLFPPRMPLPATPTRALVFGNDFTKESGLAVLAEACARCGIELDMRGLGMGNTADQPGALLASYDIVFAKARSAIEAMAVGTAVVLYGYGRLGPMVTTANFSSLRPWNFGIRTLSMPLDIDLVTAELGKYSREDASELSRVVRTTCEFQPAADRIIDIYRNVIVGGLPVQSEAPVHGADYLEQWAGRYKNCFDALSDRDRWAARCNAAEQTLSRRDEQLREHQSVAEDRQRWIERCLAAEQAVAQRDDQLREHQSLIEDRERWVDRCLGAEQTLAQRDKQLREHQSLLEDRQRWIDRCLSAEASLSKSERLRRAEAEETTQVRNLLSQRDAEAADLAHQLSDVRSSATWRWSQGVLRSQAVQLLFSGLIRSVAERSRTNGALHITYPGKSQNGQPPLEPASPQPAPAMDPGVSDVQWRAERMISDHGFLGVPRETFAQAGREQLIALLAEGLRPESKVLEFGCGCLRIASWLVPFLTAGGYHGIEPARQRVHHGLHYLFIPEELDRKRPSFDHNAVFDSSVFGTKFNFFLARSIWTHASKPQMEATLDSFVRDAAPQAIFLASYLPAQSLDEDYQGAEWVGTSHESATPGVIRHSLTWIVEQCRHRALSCEEIPGIDCDGQSWLRIRFAQRF